jgi:hypothetical protein
MDHDETSSRFADGVWIAKHRFVGFNLHLANLIALQGVRRHFTQLSQIGFVQQLHHAHTSSLRGMFEQVRFVDLHRRG